MDLSYSRERLRRDRYSILFSPEGDVGFVVSVRKQGSSEVLLREEIETPQEAKEMFLKFVEASTEELAVFLSP